MAKLFLIIKIMKDFNDINEKYNNFFPCLLSIESKKIFFKMNNHNLIFSYMEIGD